MLACSTCIEQIENSEATDANHWRCLNDSMWSEFRAVKVVAWECYTVSKDGWSQDLLDMMYLEDEELRFAEATGEHLDESEK